MRLVPRIRITRGVSYRMQRWLGILTIWAILARVILGMPVGAALPAPAWPMRSRDYAATAFDRTVGINRSNVATLQPRWRFTADDAIPESAAVGRDTVFVGSARGTLYALDLATGRKRGP